MKQKNSQKNRVLELDLLRVLAIALIYLQHLFHLCIPDPINLSQCELFLNLARINPGELGVSLFIFLSGFTLTRFSIKNKSIKEFYLGRFLRLYIPFWIAYFPILIYFLTNKLLPLKISFGSMLLSFFGLDGYLSSFFSINSWYLIGEWFFGFIIIIYIIYPKLYSLFKANKYVYLLACLVVVYIVSKFQLIMPLRVVPLRLLEFSTGMLIATFSNNNTRQIFFKILIILGALILNEGLIKFGIFYVIVKLILIDIVFYYIACEIAKIFSSNKSRIFIFLKNFVVLLSGISFPFFLIHHVVILKTIKSLNITNIYWYIIMITIICFIFAYFVFLIDRKIMKKLVFRK